MEFPERLAHLRQQKNLTQRALAEAAGVSATIIKGYEAGKALRTLPALRRLAVALIVSGDTLLFDQNESGRGDDLRLQFETVSRISPEGQQAIRSPLEVMTLKHEARKFERSADH